MIYVYVVADTNDADYVSLLTPIESDKDRDRISFIAKAIKECGERHNWPTGEYEDSTPEKLYAGQLSEDDIEFMSNYVPYGEYGVHTIVSIKVLHVELEEALFEK